MDDFVPGSKSDVVKMYNETVSVPVAAEPEHLEMIKELKLINAEIADLNKRKEHIENIIACHMLNHERLVCPETGAELVSWKFDNGGRFEQKRFKEQYPDLYEGFCTQRIRTMRFLKG